MSGSEDLKDLLDRLKEEVGPVSPERPPAARPPARPVASAPERFFRAARPEAQRPQQAPDPGNTVWGENKEAMLFGLLTSLIALFGGVLSGLSYVVLIGSVAFLLFACLTALALFAYYLNSRGRAPEDRGLAARVDSLARKVEALGALGAAGSGAPRQGGSPERERDLERKVEELRVIVKTLARSAERQGK